MADIVVAYIVVAYLVMADGVVGSGDRAALEARSMGLGVTDNGRLYLGIADSMSIARVWTCRYSK